jgi:hypothetical protein
MLPTCAFASLNRNNLPSLPSVDTTDEIRTSEYSFVAIRSNCQQFIPWDLSVKGTSILLVIKESTFSFLRTTEWQTLMDYLHRISLIGLDLTTKINPIPSYVCA